MPGFSVSDLTVGYLGPAGTHSHIAAMAVFGPVDRFGFRYLPLSNLTKTLSSVSEGVVGFAVVPYFNSKSGAVRAVCPAVVDVRRDVFSALEICVSAGFQITHDLLGVGRVDEVRQVFSKREAIEQCAGTMSRLCPSAELLTTDSTAEAARFAEAAGGTVAAIASRELLSFHRGLKLLRAGVQDEASNVTRFMVVRRRSHSSQPPPSGLPRHTWIEFTNSKSRPVLAKLLAIADKWGLKTSAISGAVVDTDTSSMRFLVEVDQPLDTWKSKLFLSEATHLKPTIIGVPIVAEPGEDDLLRKWCQHQAVYTQEVQYSENKEALRRLAPHVRDSVAHGDGCRLLIHSPVATMESVWEVLGVSAKRMLNTQVCVNVSTTEVAFCSVPGGRRVDIDKLSRMLGGAWRRATGQELRKLGQNTGAISPLTANVGVRIVIDIDVPVTGLVFVGSGDPTVSIVIDTDRNKAFAAAIRAEISED